MPLLFALAGISLAATVLLLLLPPVVLGARLPGREGVRGFLLYFVFIGCGYLLIEVALIQKFVLFLGHPTYALTVVIFSMLLASGLGSYFSGRLLEHHEGRLIKILGCVALCAVLWAWILSALLPAAVGLPLPLKVSMTVLLIAANSAAMTVRERTAEVAIMRALGFGREAVAELLFGECAAIGLIGGLLGSICAWRLCSDGLTLGAVLNGNGALWVTSRQAFAALTRPRSALTLTNDK